MTNSDQKSNYAEFTYEIEEVTTSYITVSYSDGSRAEIPLISGQKKEDIIERIGEYYHPPEAAFETEGHVPFIVGEVGTSKKQVRSIRKEKNFDDGEEVYTYQDYRYQNYPSPHIMLRALYEARQGDDTLQKQIDQQIASVDEMYPEDMPSMTKTEHVEYLTQFIDL